MRVVRVAAAPARHCARRRGLVRRRAPRKVHGRIRRRVRDRVRRGVRRAVLVRAGRALCRCGGRRRVGCARARVDRREYRGRHVGSGRDAGGLPPAFPAPAPATAAVALATSATDPSVASATAAPVRPRWRVNRLMLMAWSSLRIRGETPGTGDSPLTPALNVPGRRCVRGDRWAGSPNTGRPFLAGGRSRRARSPP